MRHSLNRRCKLFGRSQCTIKRFFLLFFSIFPALAWESTPPPIPVEPQRIVSTAPSITEMLYSLGLGDRVVGVTTYCHYPSEVLQKPKIGNYINPDFEAILAVKADLIVVLKEHYNLVSQLKKFGLPLTVLQHNDLAGIYQSLIRLGEVTGTYELAMAQINHLQSELTKIRQQIIDRPLRSVMFVVGRTPATVEDLIVVGRGSFLNELIVIAGGQNIFADTLTHYPRIPREEIYARRPEVIIDMGNMGATTNIPDKHHELVKALWKQMAKLPAVKTGRVYPITENFFVVPGPRVIEATKRFVKMIHPEITQ